MAASFERVFDMQGFDKNARWQMVPLGGVRYVVLRYGKDLTVTSTTSAVRFDEVPRSELPAGRRDSIETTDRILKITGQSTGPATLHASSANGAVKAKLYTNVHPKRSLLLTFNFVTDTGGHFTLRNSLSAPGWVNEINRIYNGQANIYVTLLRTQLITIPQDLGVKIIWPKDDKDNPRLYPLFENREDPDADVNIYLVWSFDIAGKKEDTDGTQVGRLILVEDHAGNAGVTIAHELGHYLGADHSGGARETHHLMHPYTMSGRYLPMDMINLFHGSLSG